MKKKLFLLIEEFNAFLFYLCKITFSNLNNKFSLLMSKMVSMLLKGVLVLAPFVLTIWLVLTLFNFVATFIPGINEFWSFLIPDIKNIVLVRKLMSFVSVALFILLVGYFSERYYFGKLIFSYLDNLIENTPIFKFFYTSIKDLFESFVGEKKKFDKTILVKTSENPEIWRVGFITKEDLSSFGLQDKLVVYVPHSFAWSGNLFIVNTDNVKLLPNMKTADALKFIVSGGTVQNENENEKK